MKPAVAAATAALAVVCVLTGCTRTTGGQLSMTTEALSADITCRQFIELPEKDRAAVINQIMDEKSERHTSQQAAMLLVVANLLCQGMPDRQLKDLIRSSGR